MSTGSDAEWILSRKIAVKSLARHFAPWKKRFFVLDRANGLLGVRSSNDTMVVINLYSPDFLVLRHEYSVDDKNSITVKYREEDSTTVKEIVMKFETAEQLDHWEKVNFTRVIKNELCYVMRSLLRCNVLFRLFTVLQKMSKL